MAQDTPLIAEISALRYELLGRSDAARVAAQYACRRYLGILAKMCGTEEIRQKIDAISEHLDRVSLFRDEQLRADAIQRSVTELRMIIDMHLHALSPGGFL